MADDPITGWMPGGVRTEIHLTEGSTDGAFCLLIDYPPVDWSLPSHRHRNESETIHVIEGEFEVRMDGKLLVMTPGQTVHIPRGVVHSGANVGENTGKRAVLFHPSGMERFFLEVGSASPTKEIDLARVFASAVEHGWEFGDSENHAD